jgi:hypothetical protein
MCCVYTQPGLTPSEYTYTIFPRGSRASVVFYIILYCLLYYIIGKLVINSLHSSVRFNGDAADAGHGGNPPAIPKKNVS